jgi:hypothetical protein
MFLPLGVMGVWAIAYLLLIGAVGAVTGGLVSLLFRQRPSRRDAFINATVAATVGLAVAILLPIYYGTRGHPSPGGLSLLPFAVGSAILRQLIAIQRRRA